MRDGYGEEGVNAGLGLVLGKYEARGEKGWVRAYDFFFQGEDVVDTIPLVVSCLDG
jgi:hypothetical protein